MFILIIDGPVCIQRPTTLQHPTTHPALPPPRPPTAQKLRGIRRRSAPDHRSQQAVLPEERLLRPRTERGRTAPANKLHSRRLHQPHPPARSQHCSQSSTVCCQGWVRQSQGTPWQPRICSRTLNGCFVLSRRSKGGQSNPSVPSRCGSLLLSRSADTRPSVDLIAFEGTSAPSPSPSPEKTAPQLASASPTKLDVLPGLGATTQTRSGGGGGGGGGDGAAASVSVAPSPDVVVHPTDAVPSWPSDLLPASSDNSVTPFPAENLLEGTDMGCYVPPRTRAEGLKGGRSNPSANFRCSSPAAVYFG